MIRKIECFVPACDVCGKDIDDGDEMVCHFNNESEAREYALDRYEDNAEEIDGKLVCASCWMYDDNDEIVIRKV